MFDRRNFMKFVGGAVAGTMATPVIWKTLDDLSIWSQNWSWIPRLEKGENTYVRTVSKMCPSACGLNVRLVGGRPVRALGDEKSPLSLGGLSPLAATEVQLLYSPARLRRPMKRAADGGYTAISWDEAESILAKKIADARASKGLFCVSGDENGTINELLSALVTSCKSSDFYMMPSDARSAAVAWNTICGEVGRVGYDFARSTFVLSVGANILESWGPVVANRRSWGNARPAGKNPAMKIAYAGSVQNGTAAGADTWLPIRPNTELAFLLGIVHILFENKSVPAGFEPLKRLANDWDSQRIANVTGIEPEQLINVVNELQKAKAPLVIVGSESGQGCASIPMMLGMLLNFLLGRLNRDGGMRALPLATPAVQGAMSYHKMMANDLNAAASDVNDDKKASPELLLIYEANPVYAIPSEAMRGLVQKSKFSVSFSCFLDETARMCDLILPSAMGLERFDDVSTQYGVGELMYTIAKPVMKPLFEARSAGDVLLECSAKAGINLGYTSFVQVLKNKALRCGADWDVLMQGDSFVSRGTMALRELVMPMTWLTEAVKHIPAKPEGASVAVATTTRLAFGTADSGLPPFATKLVGRDIAGRALSARMNKATIDSKGLAEGRMITLSTDNGKVLAKVVRDEGVAMDTVALATGFGHTNFDEFNDGKGANVMLLGQMVKEPITGLVNWTCCEATIAKA